ncbi:transglutaminaseTgpA domain-containing protein, partial [Streptomyces hainanensis]
MNGLIDGRIRIACAAWLATVAAASALLPLVDGSDWMVQAAILLGAQTLVGLALRWRGLHPALTVGAQVAASLVLLTVVLAPDYATFGLLPGPQVFEQFGLLLRDGAEDIGHYVAPAPATDGIRMMVFGGVLLIGLLVDVLAVTARSAASAGLPLLALYSVAAGVAQEGPGWPYFLLAAAGYLVLLLAEGRDRLNRWGRFFAGHGPPQGAPAAPRAVPVGPRARTGRRIGVLTLGVAVLAPAALPSLGEGLLDLDGGRGTGRGGSGDVISVNPVVALQDQLNQQQDRAVLSYRTTSAEPSEMYLRLIALDEFTGQEWRSSRWYENRVPEAPWPVSGLSEEVATTAVTTTVEVADYYAQNSLPVPYPATSVETNGQWLFDRGTQTLVTNQRGRTSAGASYEIQHLLVRPTAAQLAEAPPPSQELTDYYTRVPGDLPQEVAATALGITSSAATDFDRAVALQDWFTTDGGFRYDTSVASGSGTQAIVNFLQQREGFCVHFAFTMAAMARTLGIPAQVAVGFTPGTRQPGGAYEVGVHNAHAWPELYFQGVGWVRFEPTPGQGNAPSYTRPQESEPTEQDPEEEQEEVVPATPSPSEGPTPTDPCQRDGNAAGCQEQQQTPESDRREAGVPIWPIIWGGGGLLLALLVAAPPLWRARTRARRLRDGDHGPLPAWRELLDSAWDFGITPLASETPRQAADRIVTVAELPAEPAAAVHRVADAVERALYAPAGSAAPAASETRGAPAAADTRAALAGLRGTAGRWARVRASLLPRSAIRVMYGLAARRAAAADRLRGLVPR